MKASLFKTLIFTHRYIGIAIGWMMLIWCLTGLVMMYAPYPTLATLLPLNTQTCCRIPDGVFDNDEPVASANVGMLPDRRCFRCSRISVQRRW
jgi:hypothetical protein